MEKARVETQSVSSSGHAKDEPSEERNSWMSEKTGDRIHPEHELVPMMQADPFFCSACRQVGIGSAYGCESCVVLVHRKCMYPPSTVAHPLQKNCSLKYKPQAETSGACTHCGACSKPLRGGTYSSDASGNPSFHPSCLHLEKCIKLNDVELNLVESCPSACDWCKEESIRVKKVEIPSWWYVSEGGKHRFHVGCAREMMVESWKSGGITCADEEEDDDDYEMSMRADMPHQRVGKRRGFVRRTILRVSTAAGVSAAAGDPTGITGIALVTLGPKLFRGARRLKSKMSGRD